MPNQPIYLDYNATTPIDPIVQSAMLPYLQEHFGNPSSTHVYGQAAHQAVERARGQVAQLIHARPHEIVFTGGGSESSNLAIKGTIWPLLFGTSTQPDCMSDSLKRTWSYTLRSLFGRTSDSVQIVTSAIEHPATRQACQTLHQLGCRVEILPVDCSGLISLEALETALQRPTALVSMMHSNNEVGTLQPIKDIAQRAHAAGALVHCDAAQSLGKVEIDVNELDVDLLSIAGHKLYAPKGIGALYVRAGINLEPLIHGAGHEAGRRAGTENVPHIVALGCAAELVQGAIPNEATRLQQLRDMLWNKLQEHLGDQVVLNGHQELRLPNTLNVSFRGCLGSELLAQTPGIAASTGAACHEGQMQLSPVLAAMGVDPVLGQGAVRLSVGRFSTNDEIDRAVGLLVSTVRRIRSAAPAI